MAERPNLGRQFITLWKLKKEIFSIRQQVFDAWKVFGSRMTRLGLSFRFGSNPAIL